MRPTVQKEIPATSSKGRLKFHTEQLLVSRHVWIAARFSRSLFVLQSLPSATALTQCRARSLRVLLPAEGFAIQFLQGLDELFEHGE